MKEEYVNLTLENLNDEHLCCAISDKKHEDGVKEKKAWLKERIKEGHVFRKLRVNGKVFIEYAPLEKAWVPIVGDNYMYIYCLWVAGSYKSKGYGKELLNYAIKEARELGKNGICVLTSKKKKPFLSEKKFFLKFGFEVVDIIDDEYELLALSFNNIKPKFTDKAKNMTIDSSDFTIYYSLQCPYTMNCIREIEEYSKNIDKKINIVKIDSLEKAKEMPCIFNNWVNFKDGKFLSNTLLNKNSIEKILNSN